MSREICSECRQPIGGIHICENRDLLDAKDNRIAALQSRLSSARELVEKLMIIVKTQSCDGCNPTGRMGATATEICQQAEAWLKENK